MLADQGVLFREAFCAAPTCSGSRASLLTGQHCHNNGMLGLAHRGWELNDYGQHWIHALRGAGYRSTLIGEQHISVDPGVIGYDEVLPVASTRTEEVVPLTIESLREAPRDRPWFMSVGFFETHRDFSAPTSVRDTLYSLPPANLPDIAATRARRRRLQGQRPLARPGDRRRPARPARLRPGRGHPGDLHHRPRRRLPRLQGDPLRPRHRGDDDRPRPRRVRGRQGGRRPGQPPRRLPDPLRAGGGRAARPGCRAPR